MIDKAYLKCQNVLVIGDLNYNLLKPEKSRELIDKCDILELHNVINALTCFTKEAEPSLIDAC